MANKPDYVRDELVEPEFIYNLSTYDKTEYVILKEPFGHACDKFSDQEI
jgi:hypothetical protein